MYDGAGHRTRFSHRNGAFFNRIASRLPDRRIIKTIPPWLIVIFIRSGIKGRARENDIAVEVVYVPMCSVAIKEKHLRIPGADHLNGGIEGNHLPTRTDVGDALDRAVPSRVGVGASDGGRSKVFP